MAPSRYRKDRRDTKVTQAFFNQGNSDNSDKSDVYPSDMDLSKLAGKGHSEDALKCSLIETEYGTGGLMLEKVSSIWMDKFNKLKPEEQESLYAAIEKQPEFLGPTRALGLAHEQRSDDPTTADHFKLKDSFDLDNLGEVAKTYDEVCQMYNDREEHEMANLAELVGELAVSASDENHSSDTRLAAELDLQVLNIYSKITVPLNSCLRQVQHFNVEKKFGGEEESYRALQYDDAKQWGEDVPAELPPSYLQRLNDPFWPTEPTSKSSKKQQKKKLSGVKALVELQRNCKLAMEEMQELKKTITRAEKPIELPSMPASFTYRNVAVPEDIPDHIRQRFFDGDFAHQEVLVLRKEAQGQLLRVRATLQAWSNTSHEVWEYGQRHVHELPTFRKYECTRTELHILFYMACRQEVKILEFYSSEGAPEFPQAMNEVFKLGSLSLEEFEKESEMRCLKLENAEFPSVHKLMVEIAR